MILKLIIQFVPKHFSITHFKSSHDVHKIQSIEMKNYDCNVLITIWKFFAQ